MMPSECTHTPRCRHDEPAIADALCQLSTATGAASISLVVALVADGPAGLGVTGMQRRAADHHCELVTACNNALKVAALQILVMPPCESSVDAGDEVEVDAGDEVDASGEADAGSSPPPTSVMTGAIQYEQLGCTRCRLGRRARPSGKSNATTI